MKNIILSSFSRFLIGALIFSSLANASSMSDGTKRERLTLFWWNVIYGKYNSKENGYPVLKRLRKVLRSSTAPDIIIFGEADKGLNFLYNYREKEIEKNLKREVKTLLNRKYQKREFEAYSFERNSGFVYFIKKGLDYETVFHRYLSWSDIKKSNEERVSYERLWIKKNPAVKNFVRPFFEIKVKSQDKILSIIPIHFCQPWKLLKSEWQSSNKAKSWIWNKLGYFYTGASIVFGKQGNSLQNSLNNPHYYQVTDFRSNLEKVMGKAIDRNPTVLIGDFNIPKKFIFKTAAFKLLERNFSDAFTSDQASYTYPATKNSGSGIDTRLKIDHSLVNKQVKAHSARVFKWRGSDHFPISVDISVK